MSVTDSRKDTRIRWDKNHGTSLQCAHGTTVYNIAACLSVYIVWGQEKQYNGGTFRSMIAQYKGVISSWFTLNSKKATRLPQLRASVCLGCEGTLQSRGKEKQFHISCALAFECYDRLTWNGSKRPTESTLPSPQHGECDKCQLLLTEVIWV